MTMDYESLTTEEQAAMVQQSIKELEAQHFAVCIEIAANGHGVGTNLGALEKRRGALQQGIRNLRKEYAAMLAEAPSPPNGQLVEEMTP